MEWGFLFKLWFVLELKIDVKSMIKVKASLLFPISINLSYKPLHTNALG